MRIILLNVLVIVLFVGTAAGQALPDSAKFTQDDFNLIVSYMQRGTIPALSDSATLASVLRLKEKLDAVLNRKSSLKDFTMTENEKRLISHFMREDLNAAIRLIVLQKKLSPQATNGKN